MKYVSEKYQQQLEDLAESLMRRRQDDAQPAGHLALVGAVEVGYTDLPEIHAAYENIVA